MNKQEKIDFVQDSQRFMEQNKVQEIFQQLLKELIHTQPQDPLQHLVDYLNKSNRKRLMYFLIGADHEQNSTIGDNVSLNYNYKYIDFKKLCKAELNEDQYKNQQNRHLFTVDDEIANNLMKKTIDNLSDSVKGVMITGYPMTLGQITFVQKMGITLDKLFIVKDENNMQHFQKQCNENEIQNIVGNYNQIYDLNIRDIKKAYQYYTELECQGLELKIEQIIQLYNRKKTPLRPPRVLIVRKSQKQLSKRLVNEISQKLDLVGIVSNDCIQKQIDDKTDLGKQLHNNKIPNDVMTYLITSQMKSIKAKNFGWICEGFPRNIEQLNKFKNDKINPDLIVLIDEENEDEDYKQLKQEFKKLYDNHRIINQNCNDNIDQIIQEQLQNQQIYN